MARTKKTPNFEQALDQLEALVDDMENGELSLEESLKAFEQGTKLTRDCQKALQDAEQKVQVLLADTGLLEDGELEDDELDDTARDEDDGADD